MTILFVAYPIFYLFDRHVVPLQNVFWHSYAQDLVMPGLIFLWIALSGETLFGKLIIKAILTIGVLDLLCGICYEYGQSVGVTPGTADKLDILCYTISIATAFLIFISIRKNGLQKA